MELKPRHLLISAALACALHIAGAAAFWPAERAGAAGAGAGGLSVSLAQAGGIIGAVAYIPPETVSEAPALEQTAAEAPTETVDPLPIEAADAMLPQAVAAVALDTLLQPVTESAPVPPVAMQAVVVEQLPAQVAEPVVVAKALEPNSQIETIRPPRPVAAEPREEQAPTKVVKPQRRPPRPGRSANQTPPKPASKPKLSAKQEAAEISDAQGAAVGDAATTGVVDGATESAAGGGDPGVERDFIAQIAALLQRHRRYPRRARSRGQEGAGQLLFVMRADGGVERVELARSAGYRLLDQEILAMLERAKPLPPIPPEIGVTQLTLRVPIAFNL
ncbi:MAG: TonB family protein, partial [Rhodobacteraceae bacterium]|nr:TonB family protein [Paracoccaceae bacterium]